MVRTVRHDSRGCILDTSREHVYCRFVTTSSHDMMTVVMKFLARSLSECWIVYLSLSLHLPRSCQCHCLCLPRANCPRPFRQNACEPSIPLVDTQNVFGNFNYVFGNHYGTTMLAKLFKLFEQELIMQLFNWFIVLLMFLQIFIKKLQKVTIWWPNVWQNNLSASHQSENE